MDFSNSRGPELLPRIPLVRGLGGAAEAILTRSDTQRLNPDLRKTLYWSLRLMESREQVRESVRAVRGVLRVVYGFMDPEYEQDAFGVIIMASGDRQDADGTLSSIVVGEGKFPVRVRRIREVAHQSALPQPVQGSTGLAARSRVSTWSPVGPGILTVKHVAGATIGGSVAMRCGCIGTVADAAPDCIDGALVTCACHLHAPTRVTPWMAVPGGTPVTYHGTASPASISTHVTATTDLLGIYHTPELPITLVLALPGAPGDSGSVVNETTLGVAGEPVGLYWGQYTSPGGATGGLAKHLGQVATLMDLDLYR